eukprot:7562387-Prorocentrum_lima.AAC.1
MTKRQKLCASATCGMCPVASTACRLARGQGFLGRAQRSQQHNASCYFAERCPHPLLLVVSRLSRCV